MTLFRTVDPASEPVTVPEMKAHLRIDHASEDELLIGLIKAAREEVERATGTALINQSWRLVLDDWPRNAVIALRRPPVRSILSITVFDADGAASLLDPGSYQLDPVSAPARLYVGDSPQAGQAMNGIEIDFTCGHGEAGTDVPDLLKRALLLLVSHWYEFRAVFDARSQPVSLPAGYERLIATYRTPRL